MRMSFEAFMVLYGARLDAYAKRYLTAFHLPGHLLEDLQQAARLAVWRSLPSWREYEGGKSAFNWCAMAMRRAMEETMRRHHGIKIRSAQAIPFETLELVDDMAVDRNYVAAAENMDLKRLLLADKKPAHIVRFIATALSPASGADIARSAGISRQAVCLSVAQTRKRLRSAMA